jgi:hypothetical protein
MRRTRSIGCFLILSGLFASAMAVPLDRAAAQDHQAQAAECLARTIQVTPVALRQARAGAWMQAVQLVGHQCDVSGEAYSSELPRALVAQLQAALAGSLAEGGQAVRQQVAAR